MTRVDILSAADHVVSVLDTVGIPAAVDPAEVELPGAWISVTEVDLFALGGGGTVKVDVYLIAPDTMPRTALAILGDLAETALTVLDVDRMTTNDALQLPDGGRPMPAFKLTTKVEV